jgi:hypothetical protein
MNYPDAPEGHEAIPMGGSKVHYPINDGQNQNCYYTVYRDNGDGDRKYVTLGQHAYCFLSEVQISLSDWGNPACKLGPGPNGGWALSAGRESNSKALCGAYCVD